VAVILFDPVPRHPRPSRACWVYQPAYMAHVHRAGSAASGSIPCTRYRISASEKIEGLLFTSTSLAHVCLHSTGLRPLRLALRCLRDTRGAKVGSPDGARAAATRRLFSKICRRCWNAACASATTCGSTSCRVILQPLWNLPSVALQGAHQLVFCRRLPFIRVFSSASTCPCHARIALSSSSVRAFGGPWSPTPSPKALDDRSFDRRRRRGV